MWFQRQKTTHCGYSISLPISRGWAGSQQTTKERRLVDAARLRRARRRMRGYFFGTGVVLAILYLIAAAFLVRVLGLELTQYWSTVMLAAGVLLGGTYAIVMVLWVGTHIIRRLINRQPIMEIED